MKYTMIEIGNYKVEIEGGRRLVVVYLEPRSKKTVKSENPRQKPLKDTKKTPYAVCIVKRELENIYARVTYKPSGTNNNTSVCT